MLKFFTVIHYSTAICSVLSRAEYQYYHKLQQDKGNRSEYAL